MMHHDVARTAMTARELYATLTPRELQVLKLICTRGLCLKDMRAAAGINAQKTLDCHKRNLHRKLKLHTSLEIACWAFKHGIIKRHEITLYGDPTPERIPLSAFGFPD